MRVVCALLLVCVAVCFAQSANNGIGFAFSGAGGRLPQHLALMEALVKGLYPGKEPIIPSYLSGASSGSISAVALNAILEAEAKQDPNGFSWDEYKSLVFNLTSSQIYDDSWEGLAKVFTYNLYEGYILDNSPLEKMLGEYFQRMGYKKLGDLFLPTSITIVNQSSGLDQRLWSTDPTYADLDLVEVVMASASLPIAFPPRTVTGFGDTLFIDGGTGIDTIPVYPLIYHPDVQEIYIICYSSAMTSGGGSVPPELDHISILKNSLALVDDMRVDLFAGAIDIAIDSTIPSFTYIPALNQSFYALDFSQSKYQYEITMEWAVENNPTPVNKLKF